MGNKCCKCQSSNYSSANVTVRSFSSYDSSVAANRSRESNAALTYETSTHKPLKSFGMKPVIHPIYCKDHRPIGSSDMSIQEICAPVFLRRLNDLHVRVGGRTRLLIELEDPSDVQVRWYKNNQVAQSERYQCVHEGGFYCLDIVPVTLEDEGLWVCTAQNLIGKSSTAARLTLTVPKAFKKPIFVENLKAILTQRGIVSLECKVIGVPTPKLRWFKDGREVKAGDIFALTANSNDDCLGIYTCEASNVMGVSTSTSRIHVTHTKLDGELDSDSLVPCGPPPKFIKGLENASGKVGDVLVLKCQVEIPPWPRSVGWYNSNGIVDEGPLYHLISDGLGMYGVEIKSLRADHNSTWKCIASSATGVKAVTTCTLSVSYPKNYRVPRFLESLRAIMTDEGMVSFECKVIGYPTPQLSWFKDGKQLQPGDVYELTGSKSLGSYCCLAQNCMGEASSYAELTVEDIQNQLNDNEKLQLKSTTQPPRFIVGLKSAETNINESLVFTVKVTTEPEPLICWYREDKNITESDHYRMSCEQNGTYFLSIEPIEIIDQAEWKCVATNKFGQTVTSSYLKLNIPKNFKTPKFLEELRIAFSNEGSVNLECKVIGVPQPQLKWFKDGQQLNPGDMHKIISGQGGTCCLGTYTCQAHNCMGTVSSSATLLTIEDKSTVKSCFTEEYLSVDNPLVRNESLSTILEERTSQMEKSYTIEEPADVSFSFDGKEVTVSLYETPDLTHDEALQIIEMYADELSEHITEDNVVDLPSLRIVKESSISGQILMEALVIDVPVGFCRQQTVSDTDMDAFSITEDTTLPHNDKRDSLADNSLEFFSEHLSEKNNKSSNSMIKDEFFSASDVTPHNSSEIQKKILEEDGYGELQTPKLFMSDSDDQILTQLNLGKEQRTQNSRKVMEALGRSESKNTEEEVTESLAEVENEQPIPDDYYMSEILTQSDEDGLYSTVLNKIRGKDAATVALSMEEDDILKIISKPNVEEFLKYMKIILEGTMVKMSTHESSNFTSTPTELEHAIHALHSLAWRFVDEIEKAQVAELEKRTTENVSNLMTAINASLLALEQFDDPFGVSDSIFNETQSSIRFDLETINNSNMSAEQILDCLSEQIKNFTSIVNRQVSRVTEQRIIAVLRNTIGTTLVYIKTLQQNSVKLKIIEPNTLVPLFSMIQPLEIILNDIMSIEETPQDKNVTDTKLKQMLIPQISSIAFSLDNLCAAFQNENLDEDQDLKNICERINDAAIQFMSLASQGTKSNNLAECFIMFTKPINDLCCHLRRLGRSTENIVSSDYGSDDKLLMDFETLFDELMVDIDTLINNVNTVRDFENNINPLGSLLEPLQDMKIGLFQVNQVLLANHTGSNMSYEVISCFENLSQQLNQLNNCIVNQSIVEESDKEMPFETSIKMMQAILFDDAIDDLGVNGILFGSVMKPLLQLQTLIVSKMASVESDLSFSDQTDLTGEAFSNQSLSCSSNNVLKVNENEYLIDDKNDSSSKDSVGQITVKSKAELCEGTSKTTTEHVSNDTVNTEEPIYAKNVTCDIVAAFKDEEPNIVLSEEEQNNQGFDMLFETGESNEILDSNLTLNPENSSVNENSELVDTINLTESNLNDICEEYSPEYIPKDVLLQLNENSPNTFTTADLIDEIQDVLQKIAEVQHLNEEVVGSDNVSCEGINEVLNCSISNTLEKDNIFITEPPETDSSIGNIAQAESNNCDSKSIVDDDLNKKNDKSLNKDELGLLADSPVNININTGIESNSEETDLQKEKEENINKESTKLNKEEKIDIIQSIEIGQTPTVTQNVMPFTANQIEEVEELNVLDKDQIEYNLQNVNYKAKVEIEETETNKTALSTQNQILQLGEQNYEQLPEIELQNIASDTCKINYNNATAVAVKEQSELSNVSNITNITPSDVVKILDVKEELSQTLNIINENVVEIKEPLLELNTISDESILNSQGLREKACESTFDVVLPNEQAKLENSEFITEFDKNMQLVKSEEMKLNVQENFGLLENEAENLINSSNNVCNIESHRDTEQNEIEPHLCKETQYNRNLKDVIDDETTRDDKLKKQGDLSNIENIAIESDTIKDSTEIRISEIAVSCKENSRDVDDIKDSNTLTVVDTNEIVDSELKKTPLFIDLAVDESNFEKLKISENNTESITIASNNDEVEVVKSVAMHKEHIDESVKVIEKEPHQIKSQTSTINDEVTLPENVELTEDKIFEVKALDDLNSDSVSKKELVEVTDKIKEIEDSVTGDFDNDDLTESPKKKDSTQVIEELTLDSIEAKEFNTEYGELTEIKTENGKKNLVERPNEVVENIENLTMVNVGNLKTDLIVYEDSNKEEYMQLPSGSIVMNNEVHVFDHVGEITETERKILENATLSIVENTALINEEININENMSSLKTKEVNFEICQENLEDDLISPIKSDHDVRFESNTESHENKEIEPEVSEHSEICYSALNNSSEDDQSDKFCSFDNDSEQTSLLATEEVTTLANIETITTDTTQSLDVPNVCHELAEEKRTDFHTNTADSQQITVVENISESEENPSNKFDKQIYSTAVINSHEINDLEEVVDENEITNNVCDQQSNIVFEENPALISDEVLLLETTEPLKVVNDRTELSKHEGKCVEILKKSLLVNILNPSVIFSDIKVKPIENVVTEHCDTSLNVETTENEEKNQDDVSIYGDSFPNKNIIIEQKISESKNGETDEVVPLMKEVLKKDYENALTVYNELVNGRDDTQNDSSKLETIESKDIAIEQETEEIENIEFKDQTLLEYQNIVREVDEDVKQTEFEKLNDTNVTTCAKAVVVTDNDENKCVVENEKYDLSQSSTAIAVYCESKESIADKVIKMPYEKMDDVKCEYTSEVPLNDSSINGDVKPLKINSQLHQVESLAAINNEFVILENVETLEQNQTNSIKNLVDRATVDQELNSAAIGNTVILYENAEKCKLNDDNQQALAIISTVDSEINLLLEKTTPYETRMAEQENHKDLQADQNKRVNNELISEIYDTNLDEIENGKTVDIEQKSKSEIKNNTLSDQFQIKERVEKLHEPRNDNTQSSDAVALKHINVATDDTNIGSNDSIAKTCVVESETSMVKTSDKEENQLTNDTVIGHYESKLPNIEKDISGKSVTKAPEIKKVENLIKNEDLENNATEIECQNDQKNSVSEITKNDLEENVKKWPDMSTDISKINEDKKLKKLRDDDEKSGVVEEKLENQRKMSNANLQDKKKSSIKRKNSPKEENSKSLSSKNATESVVVKNRDGTKLPEDLVKTNEGKKDIRKNSDSSIINESDGSENKNLVTKKENMPALSDCTTKGKKERGSFKKKSDLKLKTKFDEENQKEENVNSMIKTSLSSDNIIGELEKNKSNKDQEVLKKNTETIKQPEMTNKLDIDTSLVSNKNDEVSKSQEELNYVDKIATSTVDNNSTINEKLINNEELIDTDGKISSSKSVSQKNSSPEKQVVSTTDTEENEEIKIDNLINKVEDKKENNENRGGENNKTELSVQDQENKTIDIKNEKSASSCIEKQAKDKQLSLEIELIKKDDPSITKENLEKQENDSTTIIDNIETQLKHNKEENKPEIESIKNGTSKQKNIKNEPRSDSTKPEQKNQTVQTSKNEKTQEKPKSELASSEAIDENVGLNSKKDSLKTNEPEESNVTSKSEDSLISSNLEKSDVKSSENDDSKTKDKTSEKTKIKSKTDKTTKDDKKRRSIRKNSSPKVEVQKSPSPHTAEKLNNKIGEDKPAVKDNLLEQEDKNKKIIDKSTIDQENQTDLQKQQMSKLVKENASPLDKTIEQDKNRTSDNTNLELIDLSKSTEVQNKESSIKSDEKLGSSSSDEVGTAEPQVTNDDRRNIKVKSDVELIKDRQESSSKNKKTVKVSECSNSLLSELTADQKHDEIPNDHCLVQTKTDELLPEKVVIEKPDGILQVDSYDTNIVNEKVTNEQKTTIDNSDLCGSEKRKSLKKTRRNSKVITTDKDNVTSNDFDIVHDEGLHYSGSGHLRDHNDAITYEKYPNACEVSHKPSNNITCDEVESQKNRFDKLHDYEYEHYNSRDLRDQMIRTKSVNDRVEITGKERSLFSVDETIKKRQLDDDNVSKPDKTPFRMTVQPDFKERFSFSKIDDQSKSRFSHEPNKHMMSSHLSVPDKYRYCATPTKYRSLTPEPPLYSEHKYSYSSERELSTDRYHRSLSPYCASEPPTHYTNSYKSLSSEPYSKRYYPLSTYRCPSETTIRYRSDDENVFTRFGMRRRIGSDSNLYQFGRQIRSYHTTWRTVDKSPVSTTRWNDDFSNSKEMFKRLYFCVRLVDQNVPSSSNVKFWCCVMGYPEPRVEWHREGQKLNCYTYNASKRYQTKYDNGIAQLIIENAQNCDSGEYTCVAMNTQDRVTTTAFLTVYTSPTIFRGSSASKALSSSYSVDEYTSKYIDKLYVWNGDDLRLKTKYDWRPFDESPRYPKFISSVIADDIASYGGTIALQVRVQGTPLPNITWLRGSKPLPRTSNKYIYLDEGGLCTLLVKESTVGDSGTYICRACNLYGSVDVEKSIKVVSPQDYAGHRNVKPAIIVSRPKDRMSVAVGEDITVTLRVAGEPKPKVIWMRGARDVTFLDRSSKETVNDYVKLSIKRAQLSDAGTYFIVAKNIYGSDRAFVTVGVRNRARSLTPPRIRSTGGRWLKDGHSYYCDVNEVPGPVQSEPRVSDRGKNRVTLEWDKPAVRSEAILVYKVEAWSDDDGCWKEVGMTAANDLDVYNLKPETGYKFRVTARNRFGWGEPVATSDYVVIDEPERLPEFVQPLPGETKVLINDSETLHCHVRGTPRPRVEWFKDGELVTGRYPQGYTERGKCTLTITDAREDDGGRFVCEATNDQGRICTYTVVEVIANSEIVKAERRLHECLMKDNEYIEMEPNFTKKLINRRVEANETVRLSCQVTGLPVPSVSWSKEGRPVDFSTGHINVCQDSDNFCTLELVDVKPDDGGSYTATASNALGSVHTSCILEVINKHRGDPPAPEFLFGLPDSLEATDAIALCAQVDDFRPVKTKWFRDDVQLRNGRRVDIITDHDGKLELRIAEVTKRDSGVYTLRVSNDNGTVESRCHVTVNERKHKDISDLPISSTKQLYSKIPKFVVKPKFQEVEEGTEVIIDSEIVGDPVPKVTWLRDGLKPEYYRDGSEFLCVSTGSRYQLRIPHVKLSHTGTYTLLASNPHGQIKTLISVQVYSTGHGKKTMENGVDRTTVERLPRISRGLADVVCSENDSVSFECKLNITPEADVRWHKDGKLVRLGNEFKSELVNGDTARLEITKVGPLHQGVYTCTAFNELGQDSTSARLTLAGSDETQLKVLDAQGETMISSPVLAGECNDRGSKRLKRSSAPKFYAVLHDKIVDVGDTVRFQCSVSGYPPPWSSWEKDGQPIGVNSRMKIREDEDYRSLEIFDIVAEDAGLYRVTVENKYGKIQATAKLQVLPSHKVQEDVQITAKSPPRPNGSRKQSGSTACSGDNFTLSCDIGGNSMSDVTWYKNNEEIKPGERLKASRDELAARLSICNLEPGDSGVYTCIARSESGVTRCSTELSVFDANTAKDSYLQPPIFVEGLVPKLAIREGERFDLPVKLQGAVPMSIAWYKDDLPIPDCEDFTYVTGDDGVFSLSIADPFNADSGTYSCKVLNTFGEAISYGELFVQEVVTDIADDQEITKEFNNNLSLNDKRHRESLEAPSTLPATILWGPCDTTVMRGAKIILETSYAGTPEPRIQWLRAGKVLESDEHLRITNSDGISSLTIESITADDCGKYVVRVDNGLGNDYHYASVAVEGPPDPPAGRPVVSVSETSADVTWSSPAYDGGCMVTGYSVEVRPFNQTEWKLVADRCYSLSHIVRGLAPGESYVFRVRAENMHGSSEASLESIPVYILQTDYGNTVVPKKVTIESGELFTSQYEVLDELGKGRYGVVHKVKERDSSKYFAAKFVRCIKAKDKEKAQEEVDIMNCLRHPKLLQLEAAFENAREVVMVTEYISGGELFERVVADDFTLTEKDCILFTRQICEGVDYMHKQNVVHLDLKPENIMCQSRTSHQIKLIDFGLAQIIEPGQPVRVLFGTPEFIPPEIISYEPIGLESDMWSVGVICYVLLSGLSPFMGDNDAETFTNITKSEFDFDDEAFDAISQDAKDFISSLLIKRKEKRLTAKECLKHKWLAQQDMDMRCVILSTDKLKKFIIRRKWQKTGNAIRALGRMATLSAASRRGGGGGGGGGGVFQHYKMASLSEEDSGGETGGQHSAALVARVVAPCCPVEMPAARVAAKTCDARSDSGISDCSSLNVPQPPHAKYAPDEIRAITEETPPATSDRADRLTVSAGGDGVNGGGVLAKENGLKFKGLTRTAQDKPREARKDAVRLQTMDNFKKAVAFWKQ